MRGEARQVRLTKTLGESPRRAFPKKLENLGAAFAMFAVCYNWQIWMPGNSGRSAPARP